MKWLVASIPAIIILVIAFDIWMQAREQKKKSAELEKLMRELDELPEDNGPHKVGNPPEGWYKPRKKVKNGNL